MDNQTLSITFFNLTKTSSINYQMRVCTVHTKLIRLFRDINLNLILNIKDFYPHHLVSLQEDLGLYPLFDYPQKS